MMIKRYSVYVVAMILLLLGACSTGEVEGTNQVQDDAKEKQSNATEVENGSSGPEVLDVEFGEVILIEKEDSGFASPEEKELKKFELTIDHYEIVQDIAEGTRMMNAKKVNEEFEFVMIDFKLENVGEITISKADFGRDHFKFFDKNNVEISQLLESPIVDGEVFESAEVRANGIFEETIYIGITKDKEPATMIYNPSPILGKGNEYVFNLQ